MQIIRHVNSFHTSNSYLLVHEKEEGVWVIDPGDSEFILNWLNQNTCFLKGIIVTHSHYDHIYGICDLKEVYPDISVYASKECVEGMQSAKRNLSEYLEMPYVVKDVSFKILEDKNRLWLWKETEMIVHYTPGHNPESLSFQIGINLFTGDALLPGVKVYTKFWGGNRLTSQETIKRIIADFSSEQLIWPGHGDPCELGRCEIIL